MSSEDDACVIVLLGPDQAGKGAFIRKNIPAVKVRNPSSFSIPF